MSPGKTDVPQPTAALISLRRQLLALGVAVLLITASSVAAVMLTLNKVNSPGFALDERYAIDVSSLQPASATRGKMRYMESCTTCHGPAGGGMPRQGANLRVSRFVAKHDNIDLAKFLKRGRPMGDPQTIMNLTMPPKGGNPNLNDQHLVDIAEFLRKVQKEAAEENDETVAAVSAISMRATAR